ncbi:hypothetical protein AVEN_81949-1 [Araneus ventricosus]|uniref:HTH CENPB-type domain-containing protein n=1 Tax=Araneus ventricosus TaxID=182803 RepID=A0A4Y2IP64_ARAVE|nr:hypothetical protein AVEN_81949-1 [Araneus ventricosus]
MIPIKLQGVERKVILYKRRNHLNHCLFSVVPDVQNGELWEKKACSGVHEVAISCLKSIDKSESLKSIALSFGVGETVSDCKEKRKEIESFCSKLETKGALESWFTLKKSKLEKLDEALLLWFNQERANGKPIKGPIIKKKVVLLHKKMGGCRVLAQRY